MKSLTTSEICERIAELDRLYLKADRLSWASFGKNDKNLGRAARRAWNAYYCLVNAKFRLKKNRI